MMDYFASMFVALLITALSFLSSIAMFAMFQSMYKAFPEGGEQFAVMGAMFGALTFTGGAAMAYVTAKEGRK